MARTERTLGEPLMAGDCESQAARGTTAPGLAGATANSVYAIGAKQKKAVFVKSP